MRHAYYRGIFSFALMSFSYASPALATDTLFSIGVGVEYTNGTYGASQATHILNTSVNTKLESGDHTVKLTLPYLVVSAPAGGKVTSVDDKGRAVRDGDGDLVTESGQGDVLASYGYNLLDDRTSGTVLDAVAKIKFGTASVSKGLGTGKNDHAFQLDLAKTLASFTALGTLGYKVLGEPVGVNFDNIWFGSVGASYRYSGMGSVGLIYDYRQAATARNEAQREISAYLSTKTDGGNRFQIYVLKGYSKSSPDWGVGLAFTATY